MIHHRARRCNGEPLAILAILAMGNPDFFVMTTYENIENIENWALLKLMDSQVTMGFNT